MTDEQKAAYIMANAVAANIMSLSMQAANTERESRGESLAYGEGAFVDLIAEYEIGCNTLLNIIHKW